MRENWNRKIVVKWSRIHRLEQQFHQQIEGTKSSWLLKSRLKTTHFDYFTSMFWFWKIMYFYNSYFLIHVFFRHGYHKHSIQQAISTWQYIGFSNIAISVSLENISKGANKAEWGRLMFSSSEWKSKYSGGFDARDTYYPNSGVRLRGYWYATLPYLQRYSFR